MLRTMIAKARWQRHERELQKGAPPITHRQRVCKVREVPVDLNEPVAVYRARDSSGRRRRYGEDEDGIYHLPEGHFTVGSLVVNINEDHTFIIPEGSSPPAGWPNLPPGHYTLRVPIADIDIERAGKRLDYKGRNPEVASSAFMKEIRAAFQLIRNLGYAGVAVAPTDARRHKVYKIALESVGCHVLDEGPGGLTAFFLDCESDDEGVSQALLDNIFMESRVEYDEDE